MKLRPYQEIGRDFLAARRHALLADEMRVGKTPQAILAAHKAGAQKIAVSTVAIAVEHWHREFRKWWPGEILPRTIVLSHAKTREMYKAGAVCNADVFIPDECHFARNPDTQLTHAIYGKGGFAWHSGSTWALSGTPMPKHAGNLYPMMKAYGLTGMDYGGFTRRYCTFSWDGKITGTNVYRKAELIRLLDPVVLRRKRRDVAPEMDDIDFQFLEVEPTTKVDLPLDVQGRTDDHVMRILETAAAKDDRVAVADAKVMPLVENISFALDNDLLRQTVAFAWHIEPLERLAMELRKRKFSVGVITGATSATQRQLIQDDFLAGKIQIVVANILAAGAGIDLSAANHGYFLELDWLPSNNMQAANRLVSMQKDEKVSMDVCTWPGSADDYIQRVLLRRAQEIATIF